MAFKTIVSVTMVAFALVATAGGVVAVPARAVSRQSTDGATSPVVGAGAAPQVVVVPQSAILYGKDKRGDKKVNVSIDVDIEKEKNPEYYGHKKGDDEQVNVSIDVDVKKAQEEEKQEHGIVLVPAPRAGSQPQEVPPESTQQPTQESQ
ncbi:hypothetical protein MMPV_002887 [Pyropia vietnamensis]